MYFVTDSGVLQADLGVIREHDHIYSLFCHECQRVFHDRLIDKTDKKYFYNILTEMSSKHFSKVCVVAINNIHVHVHVLLIIMNTGYVCRRQHQKNSKCLQSFLAISSKWEQRILTKYTRSYLT